MAYITSPVTGEEEKKEGTRGEKRGARSWFGSNSSVSTECPALPEVDVSVVSVCEEEYNAALVAGSGEREALFKLCYAKAHVSVSQSGGRDACIGMCESAATILEKMYDEQQDGLSTGTRSGDETRAGNQSMTSTMYEGVSTRELLYVLGVAHYRAGNLLKARKFLSIAMEVCYCLVQIVSDFVTRYYRICY